MENRTPYSQLGKLLITPVTTKLCLHYLERVEGIEPSSADWQPAVIAVIRHLQYVFCSPLWNRTKQSTVNSRLHHLGATGEQNTLYLLSTT